MKKPKKKVCGFCEGDRKLSIEFIGLNKELKEVVVGCPHCVAPLDVTIGILENLACQADEDCPSDYRTRHLRSALEDAFEVINKYRGDA
jgi:hypothetical protein